MLTAALAAGLAPLAAEAQVVNQDAGTQYNASALTGFQTGGNDMGGMAVRVFFSNGGTSNDVWRNLGGGQWGAQTLAFSLTLGAASDTFTSPWTLTNLAVGGPSIVRMVINGAPGGTVFDRTFGNVFGTEDSALGSDFVFSGAGPVGTVATYRNLVGVEGNAPVGDLFETLDVSFGQGLAGGGSLQYVADTDNVRAGGGVQITPEPSTYALMGAGLGALLVVQRRRRAGAG